MISPENTTDILAEISHSLNRIAIALESISAAAVNGVRADFLNPKPQG